VKGITKSDRKHFFTIARGSVQRFGLTHRPEAAEGECIPLLEVCRRRGLLDMSKHEPLREELEIMAKMISGLINGLDKRQR